jgi:hypothetical protein
VAAPVRAPDPVGVDHARGTEAQLAQRADVAPDFCAGRALRRARFRGGLVTRERQTTLMRDGDRPTVRERPFGSVGLGLVRALAPRSERRAALLHDMRELVGE